MSVWAWVLLFAGQCVLANWVIRRGGADWLEGWKALLVVDWLYASFWNAEQIRLYFLLMWLLHAAWFVVGLFVPELRGLP